MELLLYVETVKKFDLSYHDIENQNAVLTQLKEGMVPETIKVINRVPEFDFCQEFSIDGHEALLIFPVRKMMEDLLTPGSSINRFFSLTTLEEKATFFISVWKKCMQVVFSKFNSGYRILNSGKQYDVFYGNLLVDEIGIIGGEFRNTPTFRVTLPNDVVKKYYPNPVCYIPGLDDGKHQQFFDFKKMSTDDLIEYVLPYYYVDISENNRSNLRKDIEILNVLTTSCIESFFGGLA